MIDAEFRDVVIAARAVWLAENPDETDTDRVTPFDRFLYGRAASLAAPPAQGEWGPVTPDMIRECEAHLPFALTDKRDQWDWKAEYLNRALAAPNAPCSCCNVTPAGDIRDDLPAPAPVQVDEDCGCCTETTWAGGFEAIEQVQCAKHAQPPAPGEAELPPTAATWRQRWEGSGPQRGWWIIEATRLHNNDHVAYLGESPTSEAVSAIVMAHNAAIAALAQQRVHVSDEMVERACKKYAFREDGALFPDDYSPHEVAAERVLMREFLTHVIDQQQEARGNGD